MKFDLSLIIQLYKKAQKAYKIFKHSKDLLVIPYNMITELDTDEELSQTSNLTQEDDLTFDLIASITVNNAQTQHILNALNNTT